MKVQRLTFLLLPEIFVEIFPKSKIVIDQWSIESEHPDTSDGCIIIYLRCLYDNLTTIDDPQ